jgi:hypothetical protein
LLIRRLRSKAISSPGVEAKINLELSCHYERVDRYVNGFLLGITELSGPCGPGDVMGSWNLAWDWNEEQITGWRRRE